MFRFKKELSFFLLATLLLLLPSCGGGFVSDLPDPLASLTTDELLQNSEGASIVWESGYTSEEATALFGESDPPVWGYTSFFSLSGGAAQFWKGYILYGRNMGTGNSRNQVLCKYDTRTGESSPLCPDSVCLHNSEACPFYDTTRFIVQDDAIIYATEKITGWGGAGSTHNLFCYDLNTDTKTLITDEIPTDALSSCFFGKYGSGVYYCKLFADETELLEPIITQKLMRYDLKSGKTEEVAEVYSDADGGVFQWNMLTQDGRLFWTVARADASGARAEVWCLSLAEGGAPTLFFQMPYPGQIYGTTGCHLQHCPSRDLFYFDMTTMHADEKDPEKMIYLSQLYEVSEQGEPKLVVEEDNCTELYSFSAGKYLYREIHTGDNRYRLLQKDLETGEEKTLLTLPGEYYMARGTPMLLREGMLYICQTDLRPSKGQEEIWGCPILQVDLSTGRMRSSEGKYFDFAFELG